MALTKPLFTTDILAAARQANPLAKLAQPLRNAYDQANPTHTAKIVMALVPTTIAWAVLHKMNGNLLGNQLPLSAKSILPSLLAALSQSVDLVGAINIYQEMNHNLGVKLTLPKLYQFFSVVGYVFQTIGQLTITHTGVGRVFWAFNFLFLCVYTYMGYLTVAYNKRLEYPERFFEPSSNFNTTLHTVNLPALVAWVCLNLITSFVWISEGYKSIANSTYKNELLAAIGFLTASIGKIRAGYVASVTSSSEIKPFVGAMTIAAANLMAGLSLIPLAYESPVARVYVAGYASVLYSTLINSYYAFKEERASKRVTSFKKKAKL